MALSLIIHRNISVQHGMLVMLITCQNEANIIMAKAKLSLLWTQFDIIIMIILCCRCVKKPLSTNITIWGGNFGDIRGASFCGQHLVNWRCLTRHSCTNQAPYDEALFVGLPGVKKREEHLASRKSGITGAASAGVHNRSSRVVLWSKLCQHRYEFVQSQTVTLKHITITLWVVAALIEAMNYVCRRTSSELYQQTALDADKRSYAKFVSAKSMAHP